MQRANKGTQTSPIAIFRLEKVESRGSRAQTGSARPKRVFSGDSGAVTGDIEDKIIDEFLRNGIIESEGKIKNRYVRDPFKRQKAFTVSKDRQLVLSDCSEFEMVQQKFLDLKNLKLQEMLQDVTEALVSVILSPEKFFDRFWKTLYRPKRSILFGVAAFSFWAAQFFKKKFANFIFETLTVFFGFAVATLGDWELLAPSPHQPQPQQSYLTLAEEFKKYFSNFFGQKKPILLDIEKVLSNFFEYFSQNNFLD